MSVIRGQKDDNHPTVSEVDIIICEASSIIGILGGSEMQNRSKFIWVFSHFAKIFNEKKTLQTKKKNINIFFLLNHRFEKQHNQFRNWVSN